MSPFTHLCVPGFDPVVIKLMSPAFATIGGVVLSAIHAAGGVRARQAFRHGGSRGISLRIPLATSSQGAMMLPAVWAHAQRAFGL